MSRSISKGTKQFVLTLGVLFLTVIGAKAQDQFAVEINTAISQPFSINLEEYANPGNTKFSASVTFLDAQRTSSGIAESSIDIRLSLYVKGLDSHNEHIQIVTDPSVSEQHTIFYGSPEYFTGSDLAELFDASNWINSSDYEGDDLPEGNYAFNLIAFEVSSGKQVSNQYIGAFNALLQKFQPPFLITPSNGETVDATVSAANIYFSWAPQHTVQYNNFGLEYHLYIVKVETSEDPQIDDPITFNQSVINSALSSNGNYLSAENGREYITTFQPYYNFGIENFTISEEGMYAWRVEVVDPSGGSRFVNDGFSEAFAFYYASPCGKPSSRDLTAAEESTIGAGEIGVGISYGSEHTQDIRLYYRERGESVFEIKEFASTDVQPYVISGLKPSTEYEVYANAKCFLNYSKLTNIGVYTTSSDVPSDDGCAPSYTQLSFLEASAQGQDVTQLSWNVSGNETSFNFEYGVQGIPKEDFNKYESIDKEVNYVRINPPLNGELIYEYELDYVCGATTSTRTGTFQVDLSPPVIIDQLTADCVSPNITLTIPVEERQGTFTWELEWEMPSNDVNTDGINYDPDRYELHYRNANDTEWKIVSTINKKTKFYGLEANAVYEVKIYSICNNLRSSSPAEGSETMNLQMGRIATTCPELTIDQMSVVPTATDATFAVELGEIESPYTLGYKIELFEFNAVDGSPTPYNFADGSPLVVNGLAEGVKYKAFILGKCPTGTDEFTFSDRGDYLLFTTEGDASVSGDFTCGAQGDIPCDVYLTDPSDEMTYELAPLNWFQTMNGEDEPELALPDRLPTFYANGFLFEADTFDTGNFNDGYKGIIYAQVPFFENQTFRFQAEDLKVAYQHEEGNPGIKDPSREGCMVAGELVSLSTTTAIIPAEWSREILVLVSTIDEFISTAEQASAEAEDILDEIDQLVALVSEPIDEKQYEGMGYEELYQEGVRLVQEGKDLYDDITEGKLFSGGNFNLTEALKKANEGAQLIRMAIELGYGVESELTKLEATEKHVAYFYFDGNTDDEIFWDSYYTDADGATPTDDSFKPFYKELETGQEGWSYYVPYLSVEEGSSYPIKVKIKVDTDQESDNYSQLVEDTDDGDAVNTTIVDLEIKANKGVDKGALTYNAIIVSAGEAIIELDVPSDAGTVIVKYGDSSAEPEDVEGLITGKPKLGKLKVFERAASDVRNLTIIKLQSGSAIEMTAGEIEEELNGMYKPTGITWQVALEDASFAVGDWDTGIDDDLSSAGNMSLNIGEHKLLSRVSNEMSRITDLYFDNVAEDNDAAYLFEVPSIAASDAETGETLFGYMPRGRNEGFLSTARRNGTGDFYTDIAHELGHGMFALEHIWDLEKVDVNDVDIAKEKGTDNLMDYDGGEVLLGAQWERVQNPDFELYFLDEEGDAAYSEYSFPASDWDYVNVAKITDLEYLGGVTDNMVNFITPYAKVVSIDNSRVDTYTVGHGILMQFTVDGETYLACRTTRGDETVERGGSYRTTCSDSETQFSYMTVNEIEEGVGYDLLFGVQGADECHYFVKSATLNYTQAEIDEAKRLLNEENTVTRYADDFDNESFLYDGGQQEIDDPNLCYEDYSGFAILRKPFEINDDDPVYKSVLSELWEDRAIYDQAFDERVEAVVTLLNERISANSGATSFAYPKDYQDNEFEFLINPEGIESYLGSDNTVLLEHRIKYLNEYSKSLGEEKQIYVVAYDMGDFAFSPNRAFENIRFARSVFTSSSIDQTNSIVITIPYSEFQVDYLGGSEFYPMTGYYYGEGIFTSESVSLLQRALGLQTRMSELNKICFNIYTAAKKPSKRYEAFVLNDGNILYTEEPIIETIEGRDKCKEINVFEKQLYREYVRKVKALQKQDPSYTCAQQSGIGPYSVSLNPSITDYDACYKAAVADKFVELLSLIQYEEESVNVSPWIKSEMFNDIEFIEAYVDKNQKKYLEEYVPSKSFERWFYKFVEVANGADSYIMLLTNPLLSNEYEELKDAKYTDVIPEEEVYTDYSMEVIDPIVYTTIDVAGIGLSFAGCDWAADGVGLLYATLRNNGGRQIEYSLALIVPNAVVYGAKQTKYVIGQLKSGYSKMVGSGLLREFAGSVRLNKMSRIFGITDASKLTSLGTDLDIFYNALKNKDFSTSQAAELDILLKTGKTDEAKIAAIRSFVNTSEDLLSSQFLKRRNAIVVDESADLTKVVGSSVGALETRPVGDKITEFIVDGRSYNLKNVADQGVSVVQAKFDDGWKLVAEGLCFAEGTPIKVDEEKFLEIQKLQVGDSVLSYNHSAKKKVWGVINNLFRRSVDSLAKITIAGVTFISTLNHPFYSSGQYVEAKNLEKGDSVFTSSGRSAVINSIEFKDSTVTVYNFEVKGIHNYFIGNTEGYLVHNRCAEIQSTPTTCRLLEIDMLLSQKGKDMDNFMIFANRVLGDPNRGNLTSKLFAEFGDDVSTLSKFIDDFAETPAKFDEFVASPSLVDAWASVIKHTELRGNVQFLENISGYGDELLEKLDADLLNPKWKDELTDLFKESPDDVTNIWKKLKEDADYHWELYDNDGFVEGGRWEKWSQREFFKDVTAKGSYFEKEYLLKKFKERDFSNGIFSDEYLQLKNKANTEFGVNLDEYDMYSQVQLKYPEPVELKSGKVIEYFTADQVFVKWNTVNGQKVIDDVVVIENKLKHSTDLTSNQYAGKAAESLDVRSSSLTPESSVSGNVLPQGETIYTNDKWLKVYDSDNGDVISGIDKL